MIRALRVRQRLLVPVVAAISVPLVVVGLVLRTPDPVTDALPAVLRGLAAPESAPALDGDAGFADLACHAHVWDAVPGLPGPVLELSPEADPRRPDLLLYWMRDGEAKGPGPNSQLLGRLDGTTPTVFSLPAEARTARGTLLLYSLAHGEPVDHAAWPLDVAAGAP